jgi:predicted nucleic acid-binding protein
MTSGLATSLVDTYIPVYAIDPRDPFKQQRAIDALDRLGAARAGAVTVQTLNKFLWVSTRRLVPPLAIEDAAEVARYFLQYWTALRLTPDVTDEAIRGVQQHRLAMNAASLPRAKLMRAIETLGRRVAPVLHGALAAQAPSP